jgi:hypothetical protein
MFRSIEVTHQFYEEVMNAQVKAAAVQNSEEGRKNSGWDAQRNHFVAINPEAQINNQAASAISTVSETDARHNLARVMKRARASSHLPAAKA